MRNILKESLKVFGILSLVAGVIFVIVLLHNNMTTRSGHMKVIYQTGTKDFRSEDGILFSPDTVNCSNLVIYNDFRLQDNMFCHVTLMDSNNLVKYPVEVNFFQKDKKLLINMRNSKISVVRHRILISQTTSPGHEISGFLTNIVVYKRTKTPNKNAPVVCIEFL